MSLRVKYFQLLTITDRKKVEEEFGILCSKFEVLNDYNILINISSKLKKSAGNVNIVIDRYTRTLEKNIKINLAYSYYKEFGVERIIRTLRHEVAHILSFLKTGRLDHSSTFKKICTELGGSMCKSMAGTTYAASASDEYIRTPLKNYKYVYTCKCGVTLVRKVKMKDSFRNNPYKVCAKCRTSISFWKEEKIYI